MSVKLLLAGTYDDWHTLDPSRWNQPLRNRCAHELRLIAEQIGNRQADSGSAGGLHFRLEVEKHEPEADEAA